MSDKSASATVKAPVATKANRGLEEDVQPYVPSEDDDIGIGIDSDLQKQLDENKKKAAAHATKVRSVTPEQIFERRMKLPGGTSPAEAGAAVVLLREDIYPEKPMTREKKRERNGVWTQKFIEWAKKQGPEVRSPGGGLIGIGDRIEILMTNGHYRYKW